MDLSSLKTKLRSTSARWFYPTSDFCMKRIYTNETKVIIITTGILIKECAGKNE